MKELIESGKAALRCEKVWGDEKGLKKGMAFLSRTIRGDKKAGRPDAEQKTRKLCVH